MAQDTGLPMVQAISSGVAVAGHTAYVAAAEASSGWIVAYRR